MVYEYRIDASSFVDNAVLQLQPNNAIKVVTAALSHGARARLKDSNYSMFAPGTDIHLKFSADGETETIWEKLRISEMAGDEIRDTLTIRKAKNKVGTLRLLDQTFDDDVEYEGTVKEIVEAILTDAGNNCLYSRRQCDRNLSSFPT